MFKVGDEITAKFKNHLDQELTVTGLIREVKNQVLCCNDRESGRPFAVNCDEVVNHRIEQMSVLPIAGHRIDCEILDHPEDYTSPNCKKYER